jgi:hypothetical protein
MTGLDRVDSYKTGVWWGESVDVVRSDMKEAFYKTF